MGIYNSESIKGKLGENIRQAREKIGLTRTQLADKLTECECAPASFKKKEKPLSVDTLKQWELGQNAVNIEWIPALCDILHCDTGYLFGEHKELTQTVSDVCTTTGLSEAAVETLIGLHEYGPTAAFRALQLLLEAEDTWAFLGGRKEIIEGVNALSAIGRYLTIQDENQSRAFYAFTKGGSLTLDSGDFLRFVPSNSDYEVQYLVKRAQLDVVENALKAIADPKNLGKGSRKNGADYKEN